MTDEPEDYIIGVVSVLVLIGVVVLILSLGGLI